ncbi:hypothetical protein FOCC_FOCC016932, partial [Frankliniella occidentalis]
MKEMAVLTSATACAPITSHTQPGSVPNIATCAVDWGVAGLTTGSNTLCSSGSGLGEPPKEKLSFTDRLHGLGERLSALSMHRGEGDQLGRTRTGSVGASVHPLLTVTHTSYSCHEVLDKQRSSESSPSHSHSQVSRNSSRKSNNSLLHVTNGKLD